MPLDQDMPRIFLVQNLGKFSDGVTLSKTHPFSTICKLHVVSFVNFLDFFFTFVLFVVRLIFQIF